MKGGGHKNLRGKTANMKLDIRNLQQKESIGGRPAVRTSTRIAVSWPTHHLYK